MKRLLFALLPLGIFSMGNMDSCIGIGPDNALTLRVDDGCLEAYKICITDLPKNDDKVCSPKLDSAGLPVIDPTTKQPIQICIYPKDTCRDKLDACYSMYTALSHSSFTNNGCTGPSCGVCLCTLAGNTCPTGEFCDTSCKCVAKSAACGNSVKESGEQCDPPSVVCTDAKGKSSTCDSNCQCPAAPSCGDGTINQASEQCEPPGSQIMGAPVGVVCAVDCKIPAFCGDGSKNGTEACDPTAPVPGNACTTGKSCNALCACVTTPTVPKCGDNIVNQASETCDPPGSTPNASHPEIKCRADCTYCGDHTTQKNDGELCDLCDYGCPAGQGCTSACLCQPTGGSSGGQGCSPGYWKQIGTKGANHLCNWVNRTTGALFNSTFGPFPTDAAGCTAQFNGKTLIQALQNAAGGGLNAMAFHAVGALLNADKLGVAIYGLTPAQVIANVKSVCASGIGIDGLSALFESLEDTTGRTCPLDNCP